MLKPIEQISPFWTKCLPLPHVWPDESAHTLVDYHVKIVAEVLGELGAAQHDNFMFDCPADLKKQWPTTEDIFQLRQQGYSTLVELTRLGTAVQDIDERWTAEFASSVVRFTLSFLAAVRAMRLKQRTVMRHAKQFGLDSLSRHVENSIDAYLDGLDAYLDSSLNLLHCVEHFHDNQHEGSDWAIEEDAFPPEEHSQ